MEAQVIVGPKSNQPARILVGRFPVMVAPEPPPEKPTNILAFTPPPEPEKIVPKRTAISVAKELTGARVQAKEQGGYCWLFVHYPDLTREFAGRTWWYVLCALNEYLAKEKAKQP